MQTENTSILCMPGQGTAVGQGKRSGGGCRNCLRSRSWFSHARFDFESLASRVRYPLPPRSRLYTGC